MCRLRARSVRVLGVGAAAPRQQVLRQPQRPPGQRARGLVANGLALARTVGWVAQWNEMITDPDQKIGRPRQLYNGPTQRPYVAVTDR